LDVFGSFLRIFRDFQGFFHGHASSSGLSLDLLKHINAKQDLDADFWVILDDF
jgi:hypothetical protein